MAAMVLEKGSGKTRECTKCHIAKSLTAFSAYQLGGPPERCLCDDCAYTASNNSINKLTDLAGLSGDALEPEVDKDGITRCKAHVKEICDECCMDYTLQNTMQRKQNQLGRELTEAERDDLNEQYLTAKASFQAEGENAAYCTMDHMSICPRSDEKLKCPCTEGPCYCSKGCQKLHYKIHKLSCDANGRVPKSQTMSNEAMLAAVTAYVTATKSLQRGRAGSM